MEGGIPNPGVDGSHCRRCSLYYPSENWKCPHCTRLSDEEAKVFGQKVRGEIVEFNRPIAKFFLWSAVVVLIVMIVLSTGS